jgi:hypothetical protein
MDTDIRERTEAYITARYQHPAWQLLASRRAPLVLSCLQVLFEASQNSVPFDDALQSLADLLTQHANQVEFEIGAEDRLLGNVGRRCAALQQSSDCQRPYRRSGIIAIILDRL